jgi:hypothetical protein
LIRALTEALGVASQLVQTLQEAHQQARRRVRTNSILYISDLLQQVESLRESVPTPALEEALRLLESYIDLYLDFLLLEARMSRQMPSFEGIRVIKERKQPIV